jgi:HPt (histidine-containing phosphotransfer) domain-containing protein
MNAQPLADPERLLALRDDYGDVALQALEVFASAQDARNGEEVRRLAHRLRGSARTVGATGMAELAAAVEAGVPDAGVALESLEAALAPTIAALRAAIAS